MFEDLIKYPIENERLKWEARMIIRDLDQVPHLFMRLKLTGTHFVQRALEPFVTIGKVRSRFVTISDDGLSACAYFDKQLPKGEPILFGYGMEVMLRFSKAFHHDEAVLLDPKRLPANTHNVKIFFRQIE